MVRGVAVPWNLLVSALLGFWPMAAPDVFGSGGSVADRDHLTGPLVAVVAVCAMAEIIRSLRFVNLLAGVWLFGTHGCSPGRSPARPSTTWRSTRRWSPSACPGAPSCNVTGCGAA